MRIGFCGDLMLCDQPLLMGMGVGSTWAGNLLPIFEEFTSHLQKNPVDILVGNLECVIRTGTSRRRLLPMEAPRSAARTLKQIGFSALSVANNHTMEYGPDAFKRMCLLLEKEGLPPFGLRDDPMVTFSIGDRRIGLLGFSTIPAFYGHEPRYLFINGARPDDLNRLTGHLQKARREVDVLIAYPHWGVEFVTEPSLEQIQVAEVLSNEGVDLCIGAHPHIIQNTYDMNRMPTVFSLGNMVTDYPIPFLTKNLYVEAFWAETGLSLKGYGFTTDSIFRVHPDGQSGIIEPISPIPEPSLDYHREALRSRSEVRNRMLLFLLRRFPRVIMNPRLISWIMRRAFFLFRNRRLLRSDPSSVYSGPIH